MKRLEMIKKIVKELEDIWPSEYKYKHMKAGKLLKMIENEGMLPPSRTSSRIVKGIQGQNISVNYTVADWE